MNETPLKLEERVLTGVEVGESHFREFKSALMRDGGGDAKGRPTTDICTEIGEALVAFANADGGELLVGVEDDGKISGVPHTEKQLTQLLGAWKTHVHQDTQLEPPLVKKVVIEGRTVLYFQTSKGSFGVHLTANGRCLRRFDRENRPAQPERIQYEQREADARQYDRQFVPGARARELDLVLLSSLDEQIAPGYSPEKLLQFLGLAEYGPEGLMLRRAALLLFAKDVSRWHPRCEIRIIRVAGTEVKSGPEYNVVEDETVRDNIVKIVESTWDVLRPHLARTRFHENVLFRESVMYPEGACLEALTNAVAHRDYSLEGEPIEIAVFDDRMEVRSPGGLLSSLSIAQLKELKGAHESRNALVARVLRQLGFMREMGEGMRRIYESVRQSDLVDPDIVSDLNRFVMILYHKSVFSPADIQWLAGFSEFNLTKDEQRVVLLGRDGHLLSTDEMMRILGYVDTTDFTTLYEQLRRKGIIYSARKVPSGRRREIPRFRIRPPQEAQQFLAELQRGVMFVGEVECYERRHNFKLREILSPDSPFSREPVWGLQALGYASSARTPLPKLRSLWGSRSGTTASELALSRANATVTSIHERGFAFARCDETGEQFFVHCAAFLDSAEWNALRIGSSITFDVLEIPTTDQCRRAQNVRLSEDSPKRAEKTASITYKHDHGYAFAEAEDGEQFFVHASEFVRATVWESLNVGSQIRFYVDGGPPPHDSERLRVAKRARPVSGERPAEDVKVETGEAPAADEEQASA